MSPASAPADTLTRHGQVPLKGAEHQRQGRRRQARLIPVLSKGVAGAHKIQGHRRGLCTYVLDTKIYDERSSANAENDDALLHHGKPVGLQRSVLVGISSGAAVGVVSSLPSVPENKGKTHRCLLPDTGDRYLSTPCFRIDI